MTDNIPVFWCDWHLTDGRVCRAKAKCVVWFGRVPWHICERHRGAAELSADECAQ